MLQAAGAPRHKPRASFTLARCMHLLSLRCALKVDDCRWQTTGAMLLPAVHGTHNGKMPATAKLLCNAVAQTPGAHPGFAKAGFGSSTFLRPRCLHSSAACITVAMSQHQPQRTPPMIVRCHTQRRGGAAAPRPGCESEARAPPLMPRCTALACPAQRLPA